MFVGVKGVAASCEAVDALLDALFDALACATARLAASKRLSSLL